MAEGTIVKPTGTPTKHTYIGYSIGTTTTRDSGYYIVNEALKLIELSLNMNTGATLNVGQTYSVGSITDVGLPYGIIRCDVNRTDGGNAPATLIINSDGSVQLKPLASIPSGVNLRAHCMFFYQ